MTSSTYPSGIVTGSDLEAYRYMNGLLTYEDQFTLGHYITYNTPNDELIKVTGVYLKIDLNSSTAGTFTLYGSTNGSIWTSIATLNIPGTAFNGDIAITNTVSYNYYKLENTTGPTYQKLCEFSLLVDGFSCDTTAVTAGEIPNKIFRIADFYMNETKAAETIAERDFKYGITGTKLKVYSFYPEIDFVGNRDFELTVKLRQTLNEIQEITGELHKITYIKANDTHTANDAPNTIGTLEVTGADAAGITDPWKLFDGDIDNSIVVGTAGTGGVIDLNLIYTFVNPTIIYASKIYYGLKTEIVKDFEIYGSNDGTNWDILFGKYDQDLTEDNMVFTKAFDTFGSYTKYKLSVLKGITENGQISLKEISLMTEDL